MITATPEAKQPTQFITLSKANAKDVKAQLRAVDKLTKNSEAQGTVQDHFLLQRKALHLAIALSSAPTTD